MKPADTEEEFKDINEDTSGEANAQQPTGPIRVRLPRGEELIGVIEQRHGGNKMMVACLDGKYRNCRVPGRLKKKLWVREGDVLLIEPWLLGGDDKGDVVFKYTVNQVDWLRKNNHLKDLESYEEF